MIKSFPPLCLFFCILVFSSCNINNSKGTLSDLQKHWLEKAHKQLNHQPDSSLKFINAVLNQVDGNEIKSANLLEILELKQQAFSNLRLMDSFFVTGEKIREVASLIPDSMVMAKTLIPLYADVDFKHIKKAQGYIPGAIYTFTHNRKPYEAAVLNALNGMILSSEGDYVNAQKYLLKAYPIFDELDSLKAFGKVCNSMGTNYAAIGSMETSTRYYTKFLKIAEKRRDSLGQVAALMNIGINSRINSPDTAMKMYQKALELVPAKNTKLGMKLKFNMANLYLDKRDIDRGASIMKEIVLSCEDSKFLEGVGMATNGLAGAYFVSKRYPEALKNYQKAAETFNSIGLYQASLKSQTGIIDCYEAMGDYKNALSTSEVVHSKMDTLRSTEKEVAVHELEKKYQSEKRELENKYLRDNVEKRNIALIILVVVLITLAFLLQRSHLLYQQRDLAYKALMDKYKEESRIHHEDKMAKPAEKSSPILTTPAEEHNEQILLMQRLENYFETKKPYLNAKLKIEEVAAFLNCTQKDIALAFKTRDNVNFNIFANRFRVEEVRRSFEDPSCMNLKLDTIATQSGFGNRQSFYLAFEQVTGIKPGYYRKNILQQNTEIEA